MDLTGSVFVLAQLELNPSVELPGDKTVRYDHHHTRDEEQSEQQQHVPGGGRQQKEGCDDNTKRGDNNKIQPGSSVAWKLIKILFVALHSFEHVLKLR